MSRNAIYGIFAVILLGTGYWWTSTSRMPSGSGSIVPSEDGAPMATVVLPDALSANAEIGKLAFDAKCAVCHGTNAAGQDGVAPPLVHKIYEPSHHGDASFLLAAKQTMAMEASRRRRRSRSRTTSMRPLRVLRRVRPTATPLTKKKQ